MNKNENRDYLKIFKLVLTYIALTFAIFVVMLPFLWMIGTALKEEDMALKLTFLPKTKVSTAQYTIKHTGEKSNPKTVFKFLGAAQKVNLAGSFNGWSTTKDPLIKTSDGYIIEKNLKPGKYEYKFVLNGTDWRTDPANPGPGGGNSVIIVTENGGANIPEKNQTISSDNKVIFKYTDKNAKKVWVRYIKSDYTKSINWNGLNEIELKQKDGNFVKTIELPKDTYKYKFYIKRSFKLAVQELYTMKNFKEVLYNDDFPFGQFFFNSIKVAFTAALITALLCTMGGYVFAKKNFFAKEKLFYFLLAAMMIPGMMFMVPQFALVTKLNWMNSLKGMVIPHLANVFGIFLIRQYIETIPDSLFEAAKIDGASELQMFRIIVIPLSMPIIITLFLLTFLGQWTNFLWQLIVNTPDSSLLTLPVGLALFRGQYAIKWSQMMAAACFSIVPIAILFFVAQRFFIEGMTGGAVKE